MEIRYTSPSPDPRFGYFHPFLDHFTIGVLSRVGGHILHKVKGCKQHSSLYTYNKPNIVFSYILC